MSLDARTVVFAGPSLPPAARPRLAGLDWRAPARAGDALRLLDAEPPGAVVLIDGLFDGAPAIRHKELLLLLSEGVAVFGAASMGALRACELSDYGMRGVGRVFEAYARGRWTGDDEVALLHGPAELDWAPLTEPLVNVRATLAAAVRARVLAAGAARQVLDLARRTHFGVRTWEHLEETGAAPEALGRLRPWLARGRVDLKRADALAGVEAAVSRGRAVAGRRRPPPPATVFTERLRAACAQAPDRATPSASLSFAPVASHWNGC